MQNSFKLGQEQERKLINGDHYLKIKKNKLRKSTHC